MMMDAILLSLENNAAQACYTSYRSAECTDRRCTGHRKFDGLEAVGGNHLWRCQVGKEPISCHHKRKCRVAGIDGGMS
jgi:hypothetical protein